MAARLGIRLSARTSTTAVLVAACIGLTSCSLPSPPETPTIISAPAVPSSTPSTAEASATFTGSAWGITFGFDYPTTWTVTASPNSNGDSFAIVDEVGAELATLVVLQSYAPQCSYEPCENFPVVALDDAISGNHLGDGKPFAVRANAMDLTSRRDQLQRLGWDDNVRVAVGLRGNPEAGPEESDPYSIYGIGGVQSVPEGDLSTLRIVMFNAVRDFSTLQAAKEYIGTEKYLQIQTMIGSFSARACSGQPGEPKSSTGPGNNSAPDLCAVALSSAAKAKGGA